VDSEGLIQLVILIGAGLAFLFGKRQDAAKKAKTVPQPPGQRVARPAPKRKGALDELFETLQAELEKASGVAQPSQRTGPMGRPAKGGLESAEEVEERDTLEIGPRVVSMEGAPERTGRVLVDHDSQAEGVARRRVTEAQARNRGLTRADHSAFDKRIRGAGLPAPATAGAVRPAFPRAALRQAIIWQEILAPPVSERAAAPSDR